jgi:uncharacterized membrane protein
MMSLISLTVLIFAIAIVTCYIIDRAGAWLVVQAISLRSLRIHRRLAGGSNRLFLQGMNTPENCVTPLSVADAMIMFCVFELSKGPVQITVHLPGSRFWSITCYGTDTTNFFSINATHPEMRHAANAVLSLSYTRNVLSHQYSANPPESPDDKWLTAESPSRQGLILIRAVLNNPEDAEEVAIVSAALKQSTIATRQPNLSTWESYPCKSAGSV